MTIASRADAYPLLSDEEFSSGNIAAHFSDANNEFVWRAQERTVFLNSVRCIDQRPFGPLNPLPRSINMGPCDEIRVKQVGEQFRGRARTERPVLNPRATSGMMTVPSPRR